MELLVALFFLHNVLATAFLGSKFYSRKDKILKSFGTALLLNSAAFAIWSYAVVAKPLDLALYVTYGVIFFMAALVYLLNTGIQNLKDDTRTKLLLVGIIFALMLFYLRTFVYPAMPSFSPDGFFFFNVHPLIQMFYIFGLVIASLPAINSVSSKFKGVYAPLIWFCFLIQIIGGILLITSSDAQVLNLTGWAMGVAYTALWAPLLLSNKAWTTK